MHNGLLKDLLVDIKKAAGVIVMVGDGAEVLLIWFILALCPGVLDEFIPQAQGPTRREMSAQGHALLMSWGYG